MAKDLRETRIEDLPGPKSKEELEEMKMPYEESVSYTHLTLPTMQ